MIVRSHGGKMDPDETKGSLVEVAVKVSTGILVRWGDTKAVSCILCILSPPSPATPITILFLHGERESECHPINHFFVKCEAVYYVPAVLGHWETAGYTERIISFFICIVLLHDCTTNRSQNFRRRLLNWWWPSKKLKASSPQRIQTLFLLLNPSSYFELHEDDDDDAYYFAVCSSHTCMCLIV